MTLLLVALTACQTASDSDLASVNQQLADDLTTANATIAALSTRLDAVEAQLATHNERLNTQTANVAALDDATTTLAADLEALSTGVDDVATDLAATAEGVNALSTWQGEVSPLFDYVEVDSAENAVVFVGANVYVQSGSGATDGTVNGLGNLIVGYNEFTRASSTVYQNGSHNLVMGTENAFTSYAGIVAGSRNLSSAPYSSVIGGNLNTASGSYSTVLAGGVRDRAVVNGPEDHFGAPFGNRRSVASFTPRSRFSSRFCASSSALTSSAVRASGGRRSRAIQGDRAQPLGHLDDQQGGRGQAQRGQIAS